MTAVEHVVEGKSIGMSAILYQNGMASRLKSLRNVEEA